MTRCEKKSRSLHNEKTPFANLGLFARICCLSRAANRETVSGRPRCVGIVNRRGRGQTLVQRTTVGEGKDIWSQRPPCEIWLDWDSSLFCLRSTHHNSNNQNGVPLLSERGALSGDGWILRGGGVLRVGNRCIAERMPVNRVAPQDSPAYPPQPETVLLWTRLCDECCPAWRVLTSKSVKSR